MFFKNDKIHHPFNIFKKWLANYTSAEVREIIEKSKQIQ